MRIGAMGALLVMLIGSAGCDGKLTLPDNGAPGTNPDGTPKTPVDDPLDDIDCTGIACDPVVPSVTPRITRVTHHQWENAVRDLLLLPERSQLSRNFLADPLSPSRFGRMSDYMHVSPSLWEDYREAAERLADLIVDNPDALAALEPAGAPPELAARSQAFVEHFGQRAFRRPLTSEEVTRYVGVMMQAPDLYDDGSFTNAARLGIRAFLQSPNFLNMVELHDADALVFDVAPYERASRLSFALWNTIPDDALLQAAADGTLMDAAGLRAEVARMLDDPRAIDAISDFHALLLGFDHFKEMAKDQASFPNFNQNTPGRMQRELDEFIVDVAFTSGGTYRDLMTATHSFIDDDLAEIYDVEPPNGSEFGRAELGPDRPGILTRSGFLALNGTAYDPNPIHRGVFINQHMLCINLPLPPDNFSIPNGVPGDTNRERIHNATDACGFACHTPLINPPGFAFEHYDAVGAWRDTDNGFEIDATGTLNFDQVDNSWSSATELIGMLAESVQAHECYASNWFEYLTGRLPNAGDRPLIVRAAQASHQNDLSIKEIMMAVVTSPSFMQRAKGDE